MPIEPLNAFDFHHKLEATSGVSLVIFTAPGCGACKAARAALLGLTKIRPDIGLFEVDAQSDTALVREFDIFHLPSLFLYRDGEYHSPLHAEPLPESLDRAIDRQLAMPAEDAP